jgi:hypothetical protein
LIQGETNERKLSDGEILALDELKGSQQTLKRKELDGNELLILQEKTKILKLTGQVLGGVQTIDSPNARHQTYRLSHIRDILTSFPPVIQKDVVP